MFFLDVILKSVFILGVGLTSLYLDIVKLILHLDVRSEYKVKRSEYNVNYFVIKNSLILITYICVLVLNKTKYF